MANNENINPLNLINDNWIPVRRRSSRRERIAPWMLTDGHDSDPIIALDAVRPDFQGALAQFLVGLLQTAAAPDEKCGIDWDDWLEVPPSPEHLGELFAPYSGYFNLGGGGPRFLQDFSVLDNKPKGICGLLLDEPGEITVKENRDHFVKRERFRGLCLSCTAIALYGLQSSATAGGAGNRTSLRGGGPLTTLVMLDPKGEELKPTLWRDIWLNILPKVRLFQFTGNSTIREPEAVFPWLAPTRSSGEDGEDTLPEDVHPLHMYWAMPRRIRLQLHNLEEGRCGICNEFPVPVVTDYVARKHGTNYTGAWQHPLTPYYIDGKSGAPFAMHPKSGEFNFRCWRDWVIKGGTRKPAIVVDYFNKELRAQNAQLRIWAFGYETHQDKTRAWCESTVPLYLLPEGSVREQFIKQVDNLIDAATQVAYYTQSAIKEAWFSRPGDAKGDTAFIRQEFMERTESPFYTLLRESHEAVLQGVDEKPLRVQWLHLLRVESERLFEERAESGALGEAELARIARAHISLRRKLYGNKLHSLLGLPKPKNEKLRQVEETADEH